MRSAEIQALALSVIDHVIRNKPNEDGRVELKTEWPPPEKMARRLAAHANASRGEPICWLIGIDEKAATIPGAAQKELADWWPQVQSLFDGDAPSVRVVNVHHESVVVVALYFETEASPFVVKHPGGGGTNEVPWRDGNRTRSARRSELIRMLGRYGRRPAVEVLDAEVFDRVLRLTLYVEPSGADRVYFPAHRAKLEILAGDSTWVGTDIRLDPYSSNSSDRFVSFGPAEATFDGPGTFVLSAEFGRAIAGLGEPPLRVRLTLGMALDVPPMVVGFSIGPIERGWGKVPEA